MITLFTAIGKFFTEFIKTLIIDTVIKAITNPYQDIKPSYKIGGLINAN